MANLGPFLLLGLVAGVGVVVGAWLLLEIVPRIRRARRIARKVAR